LNAKVISFVSAKGGTGKTVISASFAQLLGVLNKKVLLIDADADTNGLTIFYLSQMISERMAKDEKNVFTIGIFEAKKGQLPNPFKLNEHVDIIPSTYVMEQTSNIDEVEFKTTLEQIIKTFIIEYNYIFIDAQAGSDTYAEIAMSVADEVIIVSEYDPVSISGVNRLIQLFGNIIPYEKRWLLYNKVLPEFAITLRETRIAEKILSPIPWDKEVMLAFARRRLAIDVDKGNQHTLAIIRTISSLFGKEIDEEIENWKRQKSEVIREPVQKQIDKIENEIVAVEESVNMMRHKLEELKDRPNKIIRYAIAFWGMFISYYLIFSYLFDFRITELFFAIAGVGISVTILLRETMGKRAREEQVSRMSELEVAIFKLDELKSRYQKYKLLADSDIDKLLEESI